MTIINKPIDKLDVIPDGKVKKHLKGFNIWLTQQSYASATILSYINEILYFIKWTKRHKIKIELPDKSTLGLYRIYLEKKGRLNRGNSSCAVNKFLNYLDLMGINIQQIKITIPRLISEFEKWMLDHKGVKSSTMHSYCKVIRKLIDDIGEDPKLFTASQLRSFVLKNSKVYKRNTVRNMITAIRMFIRFLITKQACSASLIHAIPRYAKWRNASLPDYFSTEEIERIISCCNPNTQLGSRDHAIILLLSRIGLRASDVANLKLCDFDWEESRLKVSGKTRYQVWLPLPQDVGDAVLHYIRNFRPDVKFDHLFVILRAPYTAINTRQISQTAQRIIVRSEIQAPSYGAHIFRHSVANMMLRQNVSLQNIGILLRHKSIETTMNYTKIDVRLLKKIALPWPGRKS